MAITGAVHLAAWLFGSISVQGLSAITMKTNAALGLTLLGLALALGGPGEPRWRQALARAGGGAALLLGTLTLLENLAGWELGIDEMIAREPTGALGVIHPNRMGIPASLSFVLVGLALVLLDRVRGGLRVRIAQVLATTVLALGFLSTIGHLYEAPELYGIARLTAIALPTSICLVLLGAGLLAARPDEGFMRAVTDPGAGGAITRRLLPPVLLLPVVLGWLRLAGERAGWFDATFGNAAAILLMVAALAWLTLRIGALVGRSHARLRASREGLQRTEAIAHLGTWDLDHASRALAWSDEAFRILGREPQSFRPTYDDFIAAVHPEDRGAVEDGFRRSLPEAAACELEHRIVRPDGTVRWVHDKFEHVRDGSGRVLRSFGMIHDISERRLARHERERLAESVERERALLDAVIEHLPVGLAIAEAPSGRLIRVNEQTRRIWRAGRGEAGHEADDGGLPVLHPDGTPYLAEDGQLARALRGEVIRGEETVFARADGTRGVMRSNAGPVRDQAGRIVAAVASTEDVTREKEAGQALRRSEERYRGLFDSMSEGFAVQEVIRDAAGRVCDWRFLEVNPAFERLTGLGREQVLGRSAQDVLGDVEPAWAGAFAHVADSGEPAAFETWSERFGCWLQVSAYRTEPGRVAAVLSDVTARKRAEAALVEANERLREASRGKDEFLALLSHELRNPLAPIRNSLYVLDRAEPGTAGARRALAIVNRQTAQLARLVDDLLDVTRIMRGKILLKRERLELNELVRATVEDHRSLFDVAGLALQVELARGPLHVLGDWNRLTQAVGNLLHNAVKFTPRGGSARVAVGPEPDGTFARVEVGDSGIGMTAETLASLFEPFVQADSSLDRTRGGLGLGLALVKGIVELHGGTAGARSEGLGRGSSLFMRVPLMREPAATDLAEVMPARGPRRRVLIIEDNADSAESLAEALAMLGHEVATAYDGPGGIERARAFAPDVVLCDIGLPGMNGFEVATLLRRDGLAPGAVLVALTGYVLPDDLRRANEAGFDRHLAKPASLEALEEVLATAPGRGA